MHINLIKMIYDVISSNSSEISDKESDISLFHRLNKQKKEESYFCYWTAQKHQKYSWLVKKCVHI